MLGNETDFNYVENTAKVTDALQEEQVLYQGGTGNFAHQQQPPPQQQQQHHYQYQYQQPNREQLRTQSSYTKPKNEPLQQIPDLKPEMSLWQTTSTGSQARSKLAQAHYQHVEQRKTPPPTVASQIPPPPLTGRKMMSLEEIEAQIKNQAKSRPQPVLMPSGGHSPIPFANQHQPFPNQLPQFSQHHMHQLQQQHQKQQQQQQNQQYNPNLNPNYHAQQQLRQDVPSANYGKPPIAFDSKPQQQILPPPQPFAQQQNVSMMPNPQGFNAQLGPNQRQPQFPGNVPFPINNLGSNNPAMKPPAELTEEERVVLLQEEQKRMRRNAKIAQLVSSRSKG